MVDHPIRIRLAVDELPDELIAMDAFGGFLAGIDNAGEWMHDPVDEAYRCVIVELPVEAGHGPVCQSYRPPLEGLDDEEPHPVRAWHRSRMTAYRIDDRIDAYLRWSRTSSLGKFTAGRDDTRSTLTLATLPAAGARRGKVETGAMGGSLASPGAPGRCGHFGAWRAVTAVPAMVGSVLGPVVLFGGLGRWEALVLG